MSAPRLTDKVIRGLCIVVERGGERGDNAAERSDVEAGLAWLRHQDETRIARRRSRKYTRLLGGAR